MTPSAKAAGGRGDARLSRDDIIEAIRHWVALYGEPPVSADWNPSVARWRAQEWRIERYRAGDPASGLPWPSLNAVKRRFGGSFAAAIREAGFEPRRPGPPRAPGSARPAVPARPVAPPSAADALAEELAAARAAAADLERRLGAAERRAGRMAEKAAEARLRARRSADRERRARAARDRAVARLADARRDGAAALRAAAADADARVAAAESAAADEVARACERAAAAEARAADAEARAADARADADRARTLALRATDGRRHSARRPAGPGVLAEALTAVTRARLAGDRHGLDAALAELAAASTGWRERL